MKTFHFYDAPVRLFGVRRNAEGLHPNDLGFMLMAKKVLPVLSEALAKGYGNSK